MTIPPILAAIKETIRGEFGNISWFWIYSLQRENVAICVADPTAPLGSEAATPL